MVDGKLFLVSALKNVSLLNKPLPDAVILPFGCLVFLFDGAYSDAVQRVSSSVFLLPTPDFDNIAQFVLLKGYLVNFFISQIPPTNMDQFFPIRSDNTSSINGKYCFWEQRKFNMPRSHLWVRD